MIWLWVSNASALLRLSLLVAAAVVVVVLVIVIFFVVVVVVVVELQVDMNAEESLDSISGWGRPISGTVEMLSGADFPRR